jgi:hypothetical protein
MTRKLLAPDLSRIFIFREASLAAGKLYSLFSEGNEYAVDVMVDSNCSSAEWTLTFIGGITSVRVPIRTNCLGFEFFADGEICWGRVREANWSVMGKSIVEEECGRTIGFVVSNLSSTSFRNACNEELAVARRYWEKRTPRALGPKNSHLAERYVWDRVNLEPFDERLLYCYVCILAISEKSR